MGDDMNDNEAIILVTKELHDARQLFPQFNSHHEGFAILKEEVDELWDEVKKKEAKRSKVALRKEAKQVAAMAIKFLADLC